MKVNCWKLMKIIVILLPSDDRDQKQPYLFGCSPTHAHKSRMTSHKMTCLGPVLLERFAVSHDIRRDDKLKSKKNICIYL